MCMFSAALSCPCIHPHRRPCFPHMRAIVGGAPALQATRATVGGASDLCAAVPAQEGLSQSIRPLVARSDPIQGSPDQLPLLGLLDPTWVIQPPRLI